MTNALWELTNHHDCINTKASHITKLRRIPNYWSSFQHYDDYHKKKIKLRKITASSLESHSRAIYSILQKPCLAIGRWKAAREAMEGLADTMVAYAEYLRGENERSQKRQCELQPPRQVLKAFDGEVSLLFQNIPYLPSVHHLVSTIQISEFLKLLKSGQIEHQLNHNCL